MQTPLKYLDFDLEILSRGDHYTARVLASPGGQGSAEFSLPFDDRDIENFLLKMGFSSLRRRGRDASKLDAAKQFGGKLYQAVFTGQVQQCWLNSVQNATAEDKGLRVRLRLNDAASLAELPWEFLFDATFDQFLNHSVETPLVRFLNLPSPPRAVTIQPPLKILVVISLPSDWEELSADQEWENIQRELRELTQRGVITLERTDQATLPALQRKLRQGEYHILHFVGHGEYLPERQENVLLFENADGQSRQVDGSTLGTLLLDHRSLRLVMLNACEGARASHRDPFGGVAQKVIQKGIPAVVAMQFAISDTAALRLSAEFYSALADNYPIDAALAEARRAIFFDDNAVEWATPVLYMRSPDGVIFDMRGTVSTVPADKAKQEESKRTAVPSPGEPPRDGTFEQIFKRARAAQVEAEQIFEETPERKDTWRAKFIEARQLLLDAQTLKPDDARVPYRLGQVLARLDPYDTDMAREEFRRAERLLADSSLEEDRRLLAQVFMERAMLTDPPNEKLLWRAGELAEALNDTILLGRIEQAVQRLADSNSVSNAPPYAYENPNVPAPPPYAGEPQDVGDPNWRPPSGDDFTPVGRWNIQVQDMVGSRLFVEFAPNGMFQMMQQVGLYQVPVNGSWGYNPLTKQLGLQGVVNTFQPFVLVLTINGAVPGGYAAVGNDGIGYILTRA